MEGPRAAQFRALAQAVDTDADGFISKEEMRVFMVGSGQFSDEKFAGAWGIILGFMDTNSDGKVRWPLRGHAALAESRCGVGRSAWKSWQITMSRASWKTAATPNSRKRSRQCELFLRQPGLRCLRWKKPLSQIANHW